VVNNQSSTVRIVGEIEKIIGTPLTDFQRSEIADKLREYRFEQVAAAITKAKKMLEANGATDLSNKIFGE
jgi:hypothetical protein